MEAFSERHARVLFCMLIFPLLFFALSACGPKTLPAPSAAVQNEIKSPSVYPLAVHPQWYQTLRSEKNILRGVGEGPSQAEADAMALSAISREMQVQVSSEIRTRTTQQGDSVSRRVAAEVHLKAGRQMQRARRTQHAVLQGVHYVAMEVDIRPDADILAGRMRKIWASEGLAMPAHLRFDGTKALTSGPLARRLKSLLSSPHGEGERVLPLSLERKDGLWIISLCRESLALAEVKGLFDFSVYASGKSRLFMESPSGKRLPNRLRHGEQVVFRMDDLPSSGWFSLFNLYPDGRVSVMEDNLAAGPGSLRVPEQAWDFFTNAILEQGVAQLDTYIAVFTREPLELVRFRHLGDVEGLVSGEGSYGAHRLAAFLEALPPGSRVSLLEVETR
ncbi:LPP20 lipoprotein [Desulfobotulus alkaliphilus]|uniref:LPP20 lipoprotein n=2 Tax=Desulfobotulus alkaliphilus TaxID=622671 RepID=A0A562RUZ5_9BACT|nr:LPP20 lipoprotein [Desulfobotulus alkaliphilus]